MKKMKMAKTEIASGGAMLTQKLHSAAAAAGFPAWTILHNR